MIFSFQEIAPTCFECGSIVTGQVFSFNDRVLCENDYKVMSAWFFVSKFEITCEGIGDGRGVWRMREVKLFGDVEIEVQRQNPPV